MSKSEAAPASTPSLVFIENDSMRPVCPLVAEPGKAMPAMHRLAPGLNVVSAELVASFGFDKSEPTGFLRIVVPTELPTHVAIKLAASTSARNAVIAWQKIEKREPVLKALAARLATRGPQVDAEAD